MTETTRVNVKFVSQKINKIRWRPGSKQMLQHSDTFATGSWDDEDNKVSVWTVNGSEGRQSTQLGSGDIPVPAGEPRLLCEATHHGDVTDLQYLNEEYMVASSSVGNITLFRHLCNSQTLKVSQQWTAVHRLVDEGCTCTGLGVRGGDMVVSVGEDGRIVVLSMEQRQPVRDIGNADSCTLNGVTFLKQFEIATVNASGQLKVWDLRQPANEPARIFLLTGDRVPLHCVDKHPTQPHIVATGGQDGMLCIWDMRQDKFPVTLLDAHSADMWEVKFHPSHPDNLFTCSEDGSVWHWNGGSMNVTPVSMASSSGLQSGRGTPTVTNGNVSMSRSTTGSIDRMMTQASPWLGSDASKHRIEVTNVLPDNSMPVNSIDIEGSTLLCGTDGEAIYAVQDMLVR